MVNLKEDRLNHQYFIPLGMGHSSTFHTLYNLKFNGGEHGLLRGEGGGIPGLHPLYGTLSIELVVEILDEWRNVLPPPFMNPAYK